jgi:hypothetical protein
VHTQGLPTHPIQSRTIRRALSIAAARCRRRLHLFSGVLHHNSKIPPRRRRLQQPYGPGVAVGFRGPRRFISRAASNAPVRCMTDSRDGSRAANLLLPLRCVAVAHRSPSIIPSKLLVLLCMMQAASSVIHNSRGCMAWLALLSRSEPFFIADISGKMRRALL